MWTTPCRWTLLGATCWLVACAAPPPAPVLDDQRARYRQLFCSRLAAPWTAPCTRYLRAFDN